MSIEQIKGKLNSGILFEYDTVEDEIIVKPKGGVKERVSLRKYRQRLITMYPIPCTGAHSKESEGDERDDRGRCNEST